MLNFEQDSTGVVGTGSGSGGAAGGSGDLEVAAGAGCSTTSFATADALEGSALAACPAGSVYPYAIMTIVWLYTLIIPIIVQEYGYNGMNMFCYHAGWI